MVTVLVVFSLATIRTLMTVPLYEATSKIAIWNPAEKKADRIGFKTLTDGKKVRFFKSSGEMLDA